MLADNIVAFVITATVLTMAPGLDTAMVLRSALGHGARHGLATAAGIATGCLCWGTAAALGLSALLQAWPLAFLLLKWGGAGYLLWLGGQLLVCPRRAIVPGESADTASPAYGTSLLRGFSTNMLNPKVGLFYVTLLPQFVPPATAGSGYAIRLACGAAAIAFLWFVLLATMTGVIRPWLRRPKVARWLDRVTGGVFIVLGYQLTQVANLRA